MLISLCNIHHSQFLMFLHDCWLHWKILVKYLFSSSVGNVPKFPRTNVWDPYKRLGISTDASEEEIWDSRNFLLDQYARHERSAEAIEAAFEKILMASFINRKKTKINLKSRLKKKVEESPPWVKNLLSFVEVPPTVIILRRLFLFAFMAGWSIMNSAESGPAFQVCFHPYFFLKVSFLNSLIVCRKSCPYNFFVFYFHFPMRL